MRDREVGRGCLGWVGRKGLLDSQPTYHVGGRGSGIGRGRGGGRDRRTSARTRDWSLPLVLYGCGGDGRTGGGGGGGGLCVIAAAAAALAAAVSAALIA